MLGNISLTSRQKKDLRKILLSLAIMLVAFLLDSYQLISFVLYLLAYLIAGYDVLLTALHNIKNGQIFDENFLMSIATIGALILGEYAEAVFVMVFYKIGLLFESIALGRSRDSIASLLEYAPEEARVIRGGQEEIVDPEDVGVGEEIIVLAGEKIPLDGQIIEGKSSLNMAFLTGESLPIDVEEGDEIHSGSINESGVLKVEVTSSYDDSTISRIMELIEESTEKKSVLENFVTRFSRYYTPIVVFAAILVALVPPIFLDAQWAVWIKRALIFLVVSCPCALVISVPLTFFAGIGRASQEGILVKGSNYLEALSMVDSFVFDKTGTLTEGSFEIVEEISYKDNGWQELVSSLETWSNHPIADSITSAYEPIYEDRLEEVQEIHGMGLAGYVDERFILAGNERLMDKYNIDYPQVDYIGTRVYVAVDGVLSGLLVISDIVKENAGPALEAVRKRGIEQEILLTGDKKEVALDIGEKLDLDEVYYELMPQDKVSKLEDILQEQDDNNLVAYVGDGINDAPVLMRADLGISMGALGSDVAIESADIVLMDDDLTKLAKAIDISNKTVNIAWQNVILSILVKIAIMVLSVLGYASMWMAIFGDVGVMILAILNSTRAMR